jgi:hypothetical protein
MTVKAATKDVRRARGGAGRRTERCASGDRVQRVGRPPQEAHAGERVDGGGERQREARQPTRGADRHGARR